MAKFTVCFKDPCAVIYGDDIDSPVDLCDWLHSDEGAGFASYFDMGEYVEIEVDTETGEVKVRENED